ncbi:MAG: ABC transporter substrate-binding protein [Alphaproteobacteria bacterium]|nr:ABC transporter substrate-binding protein [Alphaproteobacteria bacterium]
MEHQHRRRAATWLAAAVGIGLTLGVAPASAQMQDRTLRVAINQFPLALGNPYRGSGSPGVYYWAAIFDAPTWVDEKGKVQPAVAVSWQTVNPTTWRFKIRPNTSFSNGEKVDAAAIIANQAWLQSDDGKKDGSNASVITRPIIEIKKIDDLTFDATSAKPDPILAHRISGLYLVPPKYFKEVAMAGFARKPVGTGPYKHNEWIGDTRARMEGWDGSFRKPKIKNLDLYKLEERAARLQAFLSGQVEIMQGGTPDNFPQIEATGGLIDISPSPQTVSMGLFTMNVKQDVKALTDRRVRQALNYAVNTPGYVEAYLRNFGGRPTGMIIPSTAQGYYPTKVYGHNPEKAKQLLAEAGYPNGQGIPELLIEGVVGGVPGDSEIYQNVALDLAKVGVKMNVRPAGFGDYLGKLLDTPKWDGHGYVAINATSPLNDSIQGLLYGSCRNPSKPFYCDESLIPAFDQSDTELDAGKRNALLAQIQEKYNVEAAHIFLHEIIDMTAVSRNIKGFRNRVRTFTYEDIEFVR